MRRPRFGLPERDALHAVRLRWQRTVVLAGLTGVLTGLGVALFDWLTANVLLDSVRRSPRWAQTLAPGLGLLLAALLLRFAARGASPSTSDEYIRSFHERGARLPLTPVVGRILASVATLGSGGAMGFEGPSIYLGAAVGSLLQRRFSRFFSREDAKVLLVAGAAAGVSAIFKAPATGALFALEVPFQEDLAARAALPAVVSSAASYLTFVAFHGTTPLFSVRGNPGFQLNDLVGAALVGLLCGTGARAFVWLIRQAKRAQRSVPPRVAWLVGGAALAGIGALGFAAFDGPLALGPGYRAVTWLTDPTRDLGPIALLLGLRALATAFTLAGGGAGGLFIPLVVEGAILGRLIAGVIGLTRTTLFPLVGAAAFLGAGYRTPIAGVMFVAESTGRPGFVVPALIATAVAQLVMGRSSISPYQIRMRGGHVEERLRMPVSTVLVRDPYTVPPTATVEDLLHRHFVQARSRAIPVAEVNRYLGMVRLEDVDEVPREERASRTVAEVMRPDVPAGSSGWTLRHAVAAMEAADVDQLAIVEGETLVGVVSMDDIVSLGEILEATSD